MSYRFTMGDDLGDLVRDMAVVAAAPTSLSIPDSVGDPEAVHAVQKRYADAGFVCDEDDAIRIVGDARDNARTGPGRGGAFSRWADDHPRLGGRVGGWVRRRLSRR